MCVGRREFHGFSAPGDRRAGAAEGPGTEAQEGDLRRGQQTDLGQLAEQKDEGASLTPGSLTSASTVRTCRRNPVQDGLKRGPNQRRKRVINNLQRLLSKLQTKWDVVFMQKIAQPFGL